MKKRFIEESIKIIKRTKDISAIEEKKLRYGLEAFYNSITKMVVLIIITIILNVFVEFLLLSLIYSALRLYGFGIHAKKSWQCWVTTLPIYIFGCLFVKYCYVSMPVFLGIWFASFILFSLFAPADTPTRPLIHKEKRIRAKILSLTILVAFLTIALYLNNQLFINCIFYGMIMEDISINPLTYKILNTSFNNYKTYNNNTV